MKALVITLFDIEESVQCAKRCIRSGKKNGIEINMRNAVKASESQQLRENEGIPIEGFQTKWSRLNNVVACFMSHYFLWKECASGTEEYLIFEHDAVLTSSIPSPLNYSGVLSIGKPSYGKYTTPTRFGINKLTSKPYFPGAHAYIIKPSAAKVLVETAKTEACAADVFLHVDRFGFLEEYYPWIAEARDVFSTVQNRNGVQAKHSYQKNPETYEII